MARPPITRAHPYTPQRGQFAGQTFHTERQYRNALARGKGFSSWGAQQAAAKPARSISVLTSFRPAERDAARRALSAITDMRNEGLSMKQAAANNGTTTAAMKRYAGPALEKTANGRYQAKPYDRLVRRLHFLTPSGLISLDVRDSRSASKIGRYWTAVTRFLETGDERGLRPFQGKGVTVDKRFYPFITDPALLERLGAAGEISFEDLYADVA